MNRNSSPPLIAHIVLRLDYGGLETGLINLINGLPVELCRHAIVCLRGYSSFADRITRGGVEVFSIDKKEGKDLPAYARVWRLLRRLQPQIVHTRNLGTLDCAPVAAAAGVPVRIHGLHGWDVADLHGTSAKYRRMYRVCDLAIHRYVAVSRHLADWLERSIAVKPEKVRQIYNGVNTQRFRPAQGSSRALFPPGFLGSNTEGSLVFCSVGRLAAVKNHEFLVRGFAALVDADADARRRARLVIVGDGPLRSSLSELVHALGVGDLCWLAGMRDDIDKILASCDVFVLPSLNEGISNTILEAMAVGRPVVATRVGGNTELIQDGETGYLVPAGDIAALASALRRYSQDETLAQRHGEAGRSLVCERFSMSSMLDGYTRLYQEAVALAAG